MRRFRLVPLAGIIAFSAFAQDAPLESVTIAGSQLGRQFVLDIAGLKIGSAVNRAAIEAASTKLRDSGIFESISYNYASAPHGGYALTLTVQDQTSLADASIDIPGVDEAEAWKWLAARYPQFDRFVPKNDAAEQFLLQQLEAHLAPQLAGQKLVARMETDLSETPPRIIVSFQPENLPQVESIVFTGQKEMNQDELAAVVRKQLDGRGFTERSLQQVLDLNLRRAYEDRGMYRADIGPAAISKTKQGGLAVTVRIVEGPQYALGKIEVAGPGLPTDAMLQAGAFPAGKLANWTEIQRAIFDSARPLKRMGYLQASATPERILHDAPPVLDVKIAYAKGPLFHFGQLRLSGVTPAQEAAARKLWKMSPGDPLDFDYAREFWPQLVKALGPGHWQMNSKMTAAPGDHVMDLTLTITAKQGAPPLMKGQLLHAPV